MKVFAVLMFLFASLSVASAQKTTFSGTVYDSHGAVVPTAQIDATFESGQHSATVSNNDGDFRIELAPGIYKLEVSMPGFISVEVAEYLVVDVKQMRMDFVLFGGRNHEPCGVSG